MVVNRMPKTTKDKSSKKREAHGHMMQVEDITSKIKDLSDYDITHLIFELETHQLELETQNIELQQTQNKLENLNTQYKNLYNRAPVGYLTLDRKGIIQNANLTSSLFLSVPTAELLHSKLSDYILPEDQDTYHLHLMNALKTKQAASCELRIDGDIHRWVALDSTSTLDPETQHQIINIAIIDINARKVAQEEKDAIQVELNQVYKMEALGQLTGGIAHDFNNILAIINGFTILGKKEAKSEGLSKIENYLNKIEDASNRGVDLVKKLLIYSHKSSFKLETISLKELINNDLKIAYPIFPSRIKFILDTDLDNDAVCVEPIQFSQLFLNVLTNARDAMDGKGTIKIKISSRKKVNSKCSSCLSNITGDWIELCISDNGPGIKPSIINQIFNPFFSTKAIGKGTGLGLSVIHGIIHSFSGHVTIENNADNGCSVKFFLKAVEQTPEVSSKICTSNHLISHHGQREKLLILDDEKHLTEYWGTILKDHGYLVTELTSSLEALKRISENPDEFSLLISDQTMPDMNGNELIEKLDKAGISIPVIINSGQRESLPKHIIDDKRVLFLNKPVPQEQMLDAIRDLLKS